MTIGLSHAPVPTPQTITELTDGRDQVDVLALIDHFAQGGAETLLSRFASAAPRAGIRLSIVCLKDWDGNPAAAPLYDLGIPPVNVNVVGRPGLRDLRAVRRLVARSRPQIVHTHLGTSDLVGGLVARSLGIPAVCTIHTTDWDARGEDAKRRIVGICDARVIAVSESARSEYLRHGWSREDRVVTIHNGIDVTPSPGAGAEVRRELGLAPEDLVVGMVSALRPEKAHDVAIEAIRILLPRFPNLRLLIAGQGSLRGEIDRRSAGLGGAVVMAGMRPDVMRVFDALDICLHPSHNEAFPTTIIEAMAASVPVIATEVGGIPEILTDADIGVLIPAPPSADRVADALATLLESPERRRALGGAGRRAYEQRLTADPWVQRTRALYDAVLAESSPWLRRRVARTYGSSVPAVRL